MNRIYEIEEGRPFWKLKPVQLLVTIIGIGLMLVLGMALGIASLLFRLYLANFASYDRTCGSFAGVIVFVLWLGIANLALLFGAEFDAELERAGSSRRRSLSRRQFSCLRVASRTAGKSGRRSCGTSRPVDDCVKGPFEWAKKTPGS